MSIPSYREELISQIAALQLPMAMGLAVPHSGRGAGRLRPQPEGGAGDGHPLRAGLQTDR
jgi:hypothetical protein